MADAMNIPMPREQLERIVRQAVRQRLASGLPEGSSDAYQPNLVVNVSARHAHLCQADLETLFGPLSQLTVYRWLYQPGEFAAQQQVTVVGPAGGIEMVRLLGPVRGQSQVEVSYTDAFLLGIDAPLRLSGEVAGTPGCTLVGPAGQVQLPQGLIRAQRHVHMSPADARHYGFADGQYVKLAVYGARAAVFDRVLCRVQGNFLLEVHLDTDEGNACDLPNATGVELLP